MGKKETKLGPAASREITINKHVPYTCHVDPYTIATENGDYIQVIKLQGISFQTTDNGMLNALHDKRNTMLQSMARGNVAIWTTIIRQEHKRYPEGEFKEGGFAHQLNEKYRRNLADNKMYKNDLYISIVLRDVGALKVITVTKKLKRKIAKEDSRVKKLKAVKQITDLAQEITKSLLNYEPRRLRTYQHNGIVCSKVIEFFGRLVNGQYQRYPITRQSIRDILGWVRHSFGTETGEIRMTKGCRYFASLGIKEYCSSTSPGMLDQLLNLPMEFVLTQSFACTNKQDATTQIQIHRARMISAGDLSQSQVDELADALDDLTANRIVAGHHHFSLIVHAPTIGQLDDHLKEADSALKDAYLIVAREDLGLEASFWAQLPGNLSYRTRPALITSRNFSGFSSFHNYPSGHIAGNHWGPALALFPTASRTSYSFSFHNRGGQTPPGNGLVVGPTGTGKTVTMGFMLAMAEKYGGRRVFFDKDYGASIMVKANGGIYSAIKKGVPTGFNPLQMEPTTSNIEFCKTLFKRIAEMSGGALTPGEIAQISDGVDGITGSTIPLAERTITEMLPFMDATQASGPVKRLKRWAAGGDRSWVFDNPVDTLNLEADYLGFDMTEVLDDDELRTPIALYIVHRIKSLIDGTRIILNFDEGWKYARDPILALDLEDFFRTIRKQNGIIIFGTNDPGDVSKKDVGEVIMQQSQWQLYFPNPKARRKHYIDNMDLTEKEFDIVRNLPSRSFLIKRGVTSTVVELDLATMEDELAVLSGTTGNVKLLDRIIQSAGDNPKDFLPLFHQKRKEAA